MIIKSRSISKDHAMNTLQYIIKEEKDHIILDYDGADISTAAAFIGDCSIYKKARVKKAFVSTVISPHVDDNLSTSDLKKLLDVVFDEIKLNNRQFFAVVHQNTNTPHIHVISNRIDYNHTTWNDHHIAWQCQEACKRVSKKLGLKSAFENHGIYQGKGKSKKSAYDQKRERNLIAIRDIFNQVKYRALNIDYVFNHMKENGVEVEITKFKNGLFGVSLEYNGTKVKASKIDRVLTVVPDEKNESYKANNRFQTIIDRNLNRMLGKRTELDLSRELKGAKGDKYAERELLNESMALILFKREFHSDGIRQLREEENQKYLAKKFGAKHKQIGFKVQI